MNKVRPYYVLFNRGWLDGYDDRDAFRWGGMPYWVFAHLGHGAITAQSLRERLRRLR